MKNFMEFMDEKWLVQNQLNNKTDRPERWKTYQSNQVIRRIRLL